MSNTFTFDAQISPQEYDLWVVRQPNCNLLQSSKWAQVKDNWQSRLTALRDESGEIVAAGLVLIRPLKFGYTMWYLPHGPILDYTRHDVLQAYLDALKAVAKRTKCVFIRLDPPVAVEAALKDELTGEPAEAALEVLRKLEEIGFEHQGFTEHMHDTLQPRSLAVVQTPGSDVDYEASLPKRTRTFARNARNRYVQVRKGSEADLDEFMAVIAATEETKGIRLRSREYFEKLLRVYGEDAALYLAYIQIDEAIAGYDASLTQARKKLEQVSEKKRANAQAEVDRLEKRKAELEERAAIDGDYATLAGLLLIRYGISGELLYAGTNRNFGNITAQELAWVEALGDTFKAGAQYVSLGGIESTHDDELTAFKSRFTPLIVDKLGEFDYPIRTLMYKAVRYVLRHR